MYVRRVDPSTLPFGLSDKKVKLRLRDPWSLSYVSEMVVSLYTTTNYSQVLVRCVMGTRH
jgi:hypothetical protein